MKSTPKPVPIHGIFRYQGAIGTPRGLSRNIAKYVARESRKGPGSPTNPESEYPTYSDKNAPDRRNNLAQIQTEIPKTCGDGSAVFAGGFLAEFAEEFDLLDPTQIPAALGKIANVWEHKTAHSTTKAHQFLFSVHSELVAGCCRNSIPIIDVLMASATGAFCRFCSWAHPDANLGYLLGFHPDGESQVLHGVVFPFDSLGNQLTFANRAKGEVGDQAINIDYLGYLHRSYEDCLAEYAAITHLDNCTKANDWKQAVARGALVSMRDYRQTVSAIRDGGPSVDKAKTFVDISRANAKDYRSPVGLRAEQSIQRKRYISEIHSLKNEHSYIREVMGEMAQDLRASADEMTRQADTVCRAREEMVCSHTAFANSPFAYRLVIVGDGAINYPRTITKQWADSLPVDSDPARLLQSDNPYMWEIGSKLAADLRKGEAATHAANSRSAYNTIATTGPVCESLITKVGYIVACFDELQSLLAGDTPQYLATQITEEITPSFVSSPDKGFSEIKHHVIERSHAVLMKHQPFDAHTDANRDFSPVRRKRTHADDNSAETRTQIKYQGMATYRPVGISPDEKFDPIDIEEALESLTPDFRKRQVGPLLSKAELRGLVPEQGKDQH